MNFLLIFRKIDKKYKKGLLFLYIHSIMVLLWQKPDKKKRRIQMINLFTTAYAEAAPAANAAAQAPSTGALIGSFMPMILIFVLMYAIMIRPQRKKEKALREKISKMKVGDKVVSIGGICGKVAKIKDEYVFVETGNIGTQDEKSLIKFEKAAIKDIEVKVEA